MNTAHTLTRRMIGARATTVAPYYERLISERSTFKVQSWKFEVRSIWLS
jgi:hypothetical protein